MHILSFSLLVFLEQLWFFSAFFMLDVESSPRTSGASSGDDWRSAFDAAANGPAGFGRHGSNGHSRRYSDPAQNGDEGSGSGPSSGSRRTPARLPPAPPQSGSYRY